MRKNLPVTQREHRLPESATLVSTTDLKGRILHCNPSFVHASGFTRDELIGQPHNLIRHPDMPSEAFRDMWATIASGQPWQALVKNRRKDGDHYWVRANVTPVVDANGAPQGYMSVRTVPSRDEIERAEALYAVMREEAEAGTLRHVLRGGQVLRAGWVGRLRAVLRWTLGMQLAAAGVAVGLGSVALAHLVATPLALAGAVALGLLAGAFGRRIALSPLGEAIRIGNRLAAGDLSPLPPVTRDDEQGRLMKSLNQLNVNLHAIVSDVRLDVGRIQSSATEIAVGNQDLSSRTEAQASSLEETAASMEQISGTVRSSAEAAGQASTLSRQASEVAQRGGAAVQQVVDTMGAIAASSARIGVITELLDSISFQTNILALNAAVEAARAGEHGRSFAVVAGEVRQLAQRSADASREIRGLIEASREQVAQGGALADGARRTMDEIQAAIAKADAFIGEVSHAAHEQTGGIRQINEAVSHIDTLTQQNAAMVEQLAAAAQGLREQSELVSASVGVFRLRD